MSLTKRISFRDDSSSTAPQTLDSGCLAVEDECGGCGESSDGEKPGLKRRVDLFSGIALIVGTMIGSGIFVSPTGLLERTGSVPYSLCVWGLCGVVSMLGALAYAELGTMITSSGAEYAYFMLAFGPFPAYMFSWVSTMIIKPSQLAIICLSFGEYVVEAFTDECPPSNTTLKLVGVVTVAVVTLVNCLSVRLATAVQNFFCFCKLAAIVIIVGGGMWKIISTNGAAASGFLSTPEEYAKVPSIGALATAFYSGLWAYDGWNNLNYVTEEIINPKRNLPLSIIIAIPMVTVCYLLVNISYLSVMSPSEMLISDAVAITFGNRILGAFAFLMPLSVAVSTFGSANGTIFAAGRLCYVASREGHLVDVLSFVHKDVLTPAPALLFHALVAIVMIVSGDIESLIDFFSFTVWIFYGMSMLALLILRRNRPNLPRPYKVPLAIPIIVLIMSIYLVLAPIVNDPRVEYIYSALFMAFGGFIYLPFVRYKLKLPFIDKLTQWSQLLFKIIPPGTMPDC
ncbi:b(0,+)-type amino acid transporter 1 [Lepeophtheirus salmonis]|uniref:b(0,+)-type amino acid transporter 1 n=1 Tax=Lepeophtheirus salmonis TaxID=72036 RepID=A0A0K2UC51_LEPSM|nr:b(0,+)-type amino acid transporter 1-like [Lepeophtheirus salmonis]